MRAIALLAAVLIFSPGPALAEENELSEVLLEFQRLGTEQPAAALELLDRTLGQGEPDLAGESDPESLAELYRLRTSLRRSKGDYPLAMADAQRLGLLAHQLGDIGMEAQSLFLQGTVEAEQGRYGAAMEHFHAARGLLETADHPGQLARIYNAIGVTHNFAEHSARAREYFELALASARQAEDDFLIATYTGNLATVIAATEGPEAALPMQREVYAAGERLGDASMQIVAMANICNLLVDSGRLEEADRTCPEAMAEVDRLEGSRVRAGIRMAVGKLRAKQGQLEQALEVYEEGLDIARGIVPTVHRDLLEVLAELHERMDHPQAALERYRELISLHDENLERERQGMVEELEIRYQIERSAAELQLLRLDADLQATQIRLRNALVMGLAFLLLIAIAATGGALHAHRIQSRLRKELAARNDELEQAVSRISELARRDPLTGLLNRRALEELAEQELARKRREETPLCLVLADIDLFKPINDRHGHSVGDEVLKSLAQRLRELFRASDLIARWGGEEFLCLLPNTSLEEAVAAIDRFRADLKEHPIQTGIGPLEITLTFGLAVVEDDLRTAILTADQAMYQGKAAGRDRLVVSSGPDQDHHG